MRHIERRVVRELRAMTRNQVLIKALEGRLSWLQAADILGITARQMRRLRRRYESEGFDGLRDQRSGRVMRKRVPARTITELCRLRRERYLDYSIKHFHDVVTEQHGLRLSYSWTRQVLQTMGLAEKAPGRGKYRRRRDRRPMVGMLLHLDASTHSWIPDLPMQDLVVLLDDADGRILYARFVEQEGTLSTFQALLHVLSRHGRFSEFYTDRGSHFCHTSTAGDSPDEAYPSQVQRALRTLGIRHILAHSPQARGRSERAFGTIQGRLPQELRTAGICTYPQANAYLESRFLPDFNRRFTVKPAQPESAFVPIPKIDLAMVLSAQYERTVRNDGTVTYRGHTFQLPPSDQRISYSRCVVTVHHFADDTWGVSYQGRLLARFTPDGEQIPRKRAA